VQPIKHDKWHKPGKERMRNIIAKLVVGKEKLPIDIQGEGELVMSEGVYKVRWVEELEQGTKTFELYSSGAWDYDDEILRGSASGRTMPPHSKKWLIKLTKLGYAPDYARAVWVEWNLLNFEAKRDN
jgi:hypothetical protein